MRRYRLSVNGRTTGPALMADVPLHLSSHRQDDSLSRDLDTGVAELWTSARDNSPKRPVPLYTPAERQRRDRSGWTLVQGILAPLQFAVFAVSLVLVLRYLATGDGYAAATVSIVVKTAFLYAIMITGSLWERAVFGKYLFAPAFFWEDAVSMVVIALHTAYLWALWTGALDPRALMILALAAYATYVINATQFLLKLRAARRDGDAPAQATPALNAAASP
jgi:3-vinyl bacteriochlorophyllide hydratase